MYKIHILIVIMAFLLGSYYLWEIGKTDQNVFVTHDGYVMERGFSYHDKHAYELHNEVLTLIKSRDFAQAEKSALKLTTEFPDYVGGYLLLGTLQIDQNKPNVAKKNYTKALQIKPNHHIPYTRLAYAEAKLGDCSTAIELYSKALEIDNNYARAHYGIASCYYRLRKWQLVKTHAHKAIDLKTDIKSSKSAKILLKQMIDFLSSESKHKEIAI